MTQVNDIYTRHIKPPPLYPIKLDSLTRTSEAHSNASINLRSHSYPILASTAHSQYTGKWQVIIAKTHYIWTLLTKNI